MRQQVAALLFQSCLAIILAKKSTLATSYLWKVQYVIFRHDSLLVSFCACVCVLTWHVYGCLLMNVRYDQSHELTLNMYLGLVFGKVMEHSFAQCTEWLLIISFYYNKCGTKCALFSFRRSWLVWPLLNNQYALGIEENVTDYYYCSLSISNNLHPNVYCVFCFCFSASIIT